MADLLITDVRPMGGAACDVLISDGRIAAIGPGLSASEGVSREDGRSDLLLPGLVEAHTHLDKTTWGMPWVENTVGARLLDMIDNERENRARLDLEPRRQAGRQIVQSVAKGSSHIRTHVDVDTVCGLAGIEGVMAARSDHAAICDVEIVAFPQSGLLRRPGTLDFMHAAMTAGAEVVGGLDPCGIDRDPKGHLDAVFGLSQTYGKPLDIHLHEAATMGAFSMELIIERTRALGLQGRVVVSHAFCLGDPDRALVDPLIDALAELDIGIMTTGPASRPAPPVKTLIERGVRVCSGSDGIRDLWTPYGNGDMLERAMFVGLRNNFRRDADVRLAFDVVTRGGADVMRLAGYGIEVGCAADLLIVPGSGIAEAVVTRSPTRRVIKRGRVVARDGAVSV